MLHEFEEKKREILDRINIVDLVSEHVALKRSGRRWVGLCPFHSEKTPSFTVRPEHGMFKCFGCGKGGDIFSFVEYREHVPFIEAMRILADRAGVTLARSSGQEPSGPSRADLGRVNAWAMEFFRSQLQDKTVGRGARGYVKSRRITDAVAEQFRLGLATGGGGRLREAASRAGFDVEYLMAADLVRRSDRGEVYDTFRNRLMFPVRDATGRVVGFGGRTLGDDPAKYINTRQTVLFEKGRGLYGVDLAREAAVQRGRMIVVEGYTDCLAAHQAGFSETVATLGTALTEAQVGLIRRYCEEVILLFDSDQAGEAAAERAIHVALPRCLRVRLARIPEGKDPSAFLEEADAHEFSDVLNRAVDALEFMWLQTQHRFQAEASDGQRREAVRNFLRLVAEAVEGRAVDAIQRGLLVNQVAHLLRMGRSEVDRIVSGFTSKRGKPEVSSPRQPDAVRPARPADAEQAGWIHVLEVLLNESAERRWADQLPDVRRIASERDRRIAFVVVGLSGEGEDFGLADVLARLHDPVDVERVLELARRGAQRGNFANTFRLAVERIRRAMREEDVDQRKERFTTGSDEGEPFDSSPGGRADLTEGIREHRGFSPRRLIRRAVESG